MIHFFAQKQFVLYRKASISPIHKKEWQEQVLGGILLGDSI
jgi:hypothetical protein